MARPKNTRNTKTAFRKPGRPSNASIAAQNRLNWEHQVDIISKAAAGAAEGAVRAAFESGQVSTIAIGQPITSSDDGATTTNGATNGKTAGRKTISGAPRKAPGAPRQPDSALSQARGIYADMLKAGASRVDMVKRVMDVTGKDRPVANTYIYGIDKDNGFKLKELGLTRGSGNTTPRTSTRRSKTAVAKANANRKAA